MDHVRERLWSTIITGCHRLEAVKRRLLKAHGIEDGPHEVTPSAIKAMPEYRQALQAVRVAQAALRQYAASRPISGTLTENASTRQHIGGIHRDRGRKASGH